MNPYQFNTISYDKFNELVCTLNSLEDQQIALYHELIPSLNEHLDKLHSLLSEAYNQVRLLPKWREGYAMSIEKFYGRVTVQGALVEWREKCEKELEVLTGVWKGNCDLISQALNDRITWLTQAISDAEYNIGYAMESFDNLTTMIAEIKQLLPEALIIHNFCQYY
uniref:Uncharacterized protein n=1 Tax=Clastoptera arizonana TaxID=38151 RepID=A0A1B6DBW9_9HEMI